jgi:type III pantothenate kinase
MLLAIDVGNTQTLIGLFAEGRADLVDHWRIATNQERTSDEYALVIQEFLGFHGYSFDDDIGGMAVSSVVPRVTSSLRQMCLRYFGFAALVIEPGVKTGMPIRYDDPKEVGADRIVNAVGAYDLYGGPTIVVDFGTATTFDAVSAKGEYLGGAIAPGLEVSLDALFGRAAGLRRIELAKPRNVIGRSTTESVQSGALYGYAALVDGICQRFAAEMGPSTVVLTGGLASTIGPFLTIEATDEPWLTLTGLRLVHDRNRPASSGPTST